MPNHRKTLSIVVPCFNEVENIEDMVVAILELFEGELSAYDPEIIILDNASTDGSIEVIRELCSRNPSVKAVLNSRNFGFSKNTYYGLLQATGDCAVLIFADFQDPISMIPKFVKEWERGYKIVCGIKTSSRENKLMYWIRSCYYKLMHKMSDIDHIEHFTGFGLYDRSFLDILRSLDDSTPFLRGIVAELGFKRKDIPYEQQKRKAGKSHFNFFSMFDTAMLGFTSYTKSGMRFATLVGIVMSVFSMIAALIYLVLKLLYWDSYPAGTIPVLLAVLVFGSLQLFFIGLLGEYIISINARVMHRPLVIEEERLNFD